MKVILKRINDTNASNQEIHCVKREAFQNYQSNTKFEPFNLYHVLYTPNVTLHMQTMNSESNFKLEVYGLFAYQLNLSNVFYLQNPVCISIHITIGIIISIERFLIPILILYLDFHKNSIQINLETQVFP